MKTLSVAQKEVISVQDAQLKLKIEELAEVKSENTMETLKPVGLLLLGILAGGWIAKK